MKVTEEMVLAARDLCMAGKTAKQAAEELGLCYATLCARLRKYGPMGGYRLRDSRPLKERVLDRIVKRDDGHWVWRGTPAPNMTAESGLRSERALVHHALGIPYDPHVDKLACGFRGCINPAHEAVECFPERNAEIRKRWLQSEDAKKLLVTLEELGEEYGLTRQRIQQIVSQP